MRQYLESTTVQDVVRSMWTAGKPVGAICHGPVVLARTVDPRTGRSIIEGRAVTALTKPLERAFLYATFWKLGRGYARTYPAYVEDEVRAAIGSEGTFERGGPRKRPFIVDDEQLLTARWPGDAQHFADAFTAKVQKLA
jgi:putative intracellular protease/amidase